MNINEKSRKVYWIKNNIFSHPELYVLRVKKESAKYIWGEDINYPILSLKKAKKTEIIEDMDKAFELFEKMGKEFLEKLEKKAEDFKKHYNQFKEAYEILRPNKKMSK